MIILSIETSCDDTCVTIFEAKGGTKNPQFNILANNSNSQIKTHIPYGGVYPALAKREHIKNLPIVFEKTLKESKVTKVDVIAVTSGPGLEPCLWAGIVFAEELAKKWSVPVVPVNHMEGHVLSVFGKAEGKFKISKTKFPVLSLLVSGGHTQLVLMKDWGKYKIIGETVDDAVGEAFDKVARMLGLPYPGGPHISKLAEKERKNKKSTFKFPRPMLKSKDFNFSFSGLKTSILYFLKDQKNVSKSAVALEFENAAIECLVYKTKKAIEKYKVKTLFVGGGVAANRHLKAEMRKLKIKTLFPTPALSTDNSIMIGMVGYLNYLKNPKKKYKIRANGSLRLGKVIK